MMTELAAFLVMLFEIGLIVGIGAVVVLLVILGIKDVIETRMDDRARDAEAEDNE